MEVVVVAVVVVVCVSVCSRARVCVLACVRACVCVCVRACVRHRQTPQKRRGVNGHSEQKILLSFTVHGRQIMKFNVLDIPFH